MKKFITAFTIFALLFIVSSPLAEAHSGRTDAHGGHNCSEKSKAKGLCTGYHYHNGGSSSVNSNTGSKASSSTKSVKPVSIPEPVYTSVDVYINKSWKNYSPTAYMKGGTTFVPMRAIFEDLGATIDYNSSTKTITAYKGAQKISLTVGNKKAYVTTNNVTNSISLSHSAETYKNATMVPLRFIGEALGATVEWNSSLLKVDISTAK